MPIYEFACHDCGYEFEKIQSFSDSSTPTCPNCQGTHVRRRISQPAIHFKGSGWYITDSKNSSKASANGKKEDGAEDKAGNTAAANTAAANIAAANTAAASESAPAPTAKPATEKSA
jgi:putative FmdB family regulatory protein